MLSYSGGGSYGLRFAQLPLPAIHRWNGQSSISVTKIFFRFFVSFGFSGVVSSLVSTTFDGSTLYFSLNFCKINIWTERRTILEHSFCKIYLFDSNVREKWEIWFEISTGTNKASPSSVDVENDTFMATEEEKKTVKYWAVACTTADKGNLIDIEK